MNRWHRKEWKEGVSEKGNRKGGWKEREGKEQNGMEKGKKEWIKTEVKEIINKWNEQGRGEG